MIVIVDFGSQTTHLIGRRIRDLGVASEMVLPKNALSAIKKYSPRGIILSGGPASVFGKDALLVDKAIFELGIPVLGICYGLEVLGQMLGGKVAPGNKKEYGPTDFSLKKECALFLRASHCWSVKNVFYYLLISAIRRRCVRSRARPARVHRRKSRAKPLVPNMGAGNPENP